MVWLKDPVPHPRARSMPIRFGKLCSRMRADVVIPDTTVLLTVVHALVVVLQYRVCRDEFQSST